MPPSYASHRFVLPGKHAAATHTHVSSGRIYSWYKPLLRLQLHTLTVSKETIDERDEPVPILQVRSPSQYVFSAIHVVSFIIQEGVQGLAIAVEVDVVAAPRIDEDFLVVEEQDGDHVPERERRGIIGRIIEVCLLITFQPFFLAEVT